MKKHNEDKLNTEGTDSMLRYTEDGSQTASNTSVGTSKGLPTVLGENQTSEQFESRRARRMSETGLMPKVPKIPTLENENKAVTGQEPKSQSAKVVAPVLTEAEVSIPAPVLSSLASAVKRKPVKSYSKDYWGGTVLMGSLLVFLIAQVIFAFVLVVHIVLNYDLLSSIQSGDKNIQIEQVMYETPWLLLTSMIIMYVAWLGCMWWVSKYRSGVQKGKNYWNAFLENFRLASFKKRDILYGVGIAAVMLGLQFLVLNVLPELFPSLKPVIQGSDNTGPFKGLNGFWFYLIAFGFGGVIGPICEELFFRGFLLRGFENHYSYKNSGRNMDVLEDELGAHSSTIKSMMVSYRSFAHKNRYVLSTIFTTILFGLAHFQVGGSWVTVVMTGLLGLVFAIVTLKTNRLYPSMVAHVIHNSAVFLYLAFSK